MDHNTINFTMDDPEELYQLGLKYGKEGNQKKLFEYFKLAANAGHTKAQYKFACMNYNGVDCDKNLQEALKYFKLAADHGHIDAQYFYAYMNYDINIKDTLKYYKLAADKGHIKSQNNLARMYYNGEDCEKNLYKAFKYYKLAADNGCVDAQYIISDMYDSGHGCEKNDKLAFKYTKLVADQGKFNAQFDLGEMYADGYGCEKNDKLAFKYYKLAADQGNLDAQRRLIGMYMNGVGCEQNSKEGFKYIKLAADQGCEDSQFCIGAMYTDGPGCEKNHLEAIKYYKLSADKGNKLAQCNLGSKYYNGEGCEKNIQESFKYYKLSADQGFNEAESMIGQFYENGVGCEKNISEAIKYYKKAAEKDSSISQYCLAKCYEDGIGVAINKKLALHYYELAIIDERYTDRAQEGIERLTQKKKVVKEIKSQVPVTIPPLAIITPEPPKNFYSDDKISEINGFIMKYNDILTPFFKEDLTKIKYSEYSIIVTKISEFIDKLSSDYTISTAKSIIHKLDTTHAFLQTLVTKSSQESINAEKSCAILLCKKQEELEELYKMILITIIEEEDIGYNDKRIKICDFAKFTSYVSEHIPEHFMKVNLVSGMIIKNNKFSSVHLTITPDILKKGRFHITSEKLRKRVFFRVNTNLNTKYIECHNDERDIEEIFREEYLREEINEDIARDVHELVKYIKLIVDINDKEILKTIDLD